MDTSEIRRLQDFDLRERLDDLRQEVFNLKFQATTEPIDNPGRIRELKKDVARILTILRGRELGIESVVTD